MYHMVAIPPLDQHVHRFIWRDYETEREQAVYLKTVLTFGDRSAPTIAITAMRKTAEMSKESNPKPAEAIIKNAFVDDICDSVQNVEEAKAMTSSIEKVLETGGSEAETERVLGTVWLPDDDMLTFKIKMVISHPI